MYKINLHAHSTYSDGSNTILEMASECKTQGFSACVITDHVYSRLGGEYGISMSLDKYLKALKDAKLVQDRLNYPVILGAEFSVPDMAGNEVLVFGKASIKWLLILREMFYDPVKGFKILVSQLKLARDLFDCAMILAHPHAGSAADVDVSVLDGFELYNAGQRCMHYVPRNLQILTPWANSDSHSDYTLGVSYNEVSLNVTNERELINLIKTNCPVQMVNIPYKNINDLPLEPLDV